MLHARTYLKFGQRPLRLAPRVQSLVPRPRSPEQKNVVHCRVELYTPNHRGTASAPEPVGLDCTPDAGESHSIAEGMDKDHGKQRAIPKIEEGRVDAKEIGVRELQHGAGNGGNERDLRVSDTELVEVMDVGQAEDQG